jgi:hypothetical protein
MQAEQPVAGAIAYNAPPPPPNPPANVVQQGHQVITIQQVEPRQPAVEEEAFPPPRGFVPMIQKGRLTNKVQRKRAREVFHAEHAPPATPEYLNWSELKEICPRGNNNIVIIIFLVHDNVYIPC